MSALFYLRLVGFAAGALLHLFLLALIAGYRRPRAFERVLFLVALALFLFYSGGLLGLNAQIHYAMPPPATLGFAVGLVAVGLGLLPPLLLHLHAAYYRTLREGHWPTWLKVVVWAGYLPLLYFGPFAFPRLLRTASLEFLWPGGRVGLLYGIWFGGVLVTGMFFHHSFARKAVDDSEKRFHRTLLCFFGLVGPLTIYTYALGGPWDPTWSAGLATAVMLSSLLPSALLGYFVLRYNFLQIGVQRNLVYAVSAGFLALLYLAVVRRAGTWLEPVLPPEATASILLFLLVVFVVPLQRRVARALERAFRLRVDRLQRLMAEIQQDARRADVTGLVALAESRIRDSFALASVRLALRDGPPRPAVTSGRVQRFVLRKGHEAMGVLEAYYYGATLSGEVYAALEFLAEQLPGTLDLCRLVEEKLKLERELAERERLALVGQMAASISHNLRNPLSAMKTVLQVQLENPELPEPARKDCELVVAEIDRLGAKLGQLLRYAKPSVRSAAGRQRVAAGAVAEQVVALLRRDAERRQVALDLERSIEEAYVWGSEEALSDVLSNLVVNALEALPARGSVRVTLGRRQANLVLEVTDDGLGIPPELRPKILQPFFTTKPSGTGLGLAIVERRLAEMEGSISWESPLGNGRGTRFTVTLPVAE